jgi:HAD superfamily hydrolase (TIGR01549 family)
MTYKAIIFDLDGTITKPIIDFPALKRELGLTPDQFILEYMDSLQGKKLAEANKILEKHELKAAYNAKPNDYFPQIWDFIKSKKMKTALLTRNSHKAVKITLEKLGISFDVIITREDALPKPSPQPVLLISKRLKIDLKDIILVGDFRFDILCGKNAGVTTVLLTNGKKLSEYVHSDYIIENLKELIPILQD